MIHQCHLCGGQVLLQRFLGGTELRCLQCARGPDRRRPSPEEIAEATNRDGRRQIWIEELQASKVGR